jgi:hypothetical protein
MYELETMKRNALQMLAQQDSGNPNALRDRMKDISKLTEDCRLSLRDLAAMLRAQGANGVAAEFSASDTLQSRKAWVDEVR